MSKQFLHTLSSWIVTINTKKLFEKHGKTNVGYWVPAEGPLARNTLIYIISHPSREAAKKNWAEFGSDPEWKRVSRESEANRRGAHLI
jgi:hypothetical protein